MIFDSIIGLVSLRIILSRSRVCHHTGNAQSGIVTFQGRRAPTAGWGLAGPSSSLVGLVKDNKDIGVWIRSTAIPRERLSYKEN